MSRILAALVLTTVTACQCGRPGPSQCDNGAAPAISSQRAHVDGMHLAVTTDRNGDAMDVVIRARVTRDDGSPVDGLDVSVEALRGTVSSVEAKGDGTWEATLTREATGEHPFIVRVASPAMEVKRTAVILDEVGSQWGQPMMIEGVVNTCGWEDSLAVSPDGQWLYLEYTPVSISCFLGFNRFASACTHAEGPWQAPERPEMFGAERISDDGDVKHGCPLTGLDPTPTPMPPFSVYGFKRQPDGSFSEPFPIGYENQCGSFFGPSIRVNSNGTHTMLYSWTNTAEDGADNDLYTVDFTPGSRVVLGSYARVDGNAAEKDMKHTRLGIPRKSSQGNPNLHLDSSGRVLNVLYDDETEQNKELYFHAVTGEYPNDFGPRKKLPASINTGGAEVQPYFDGDTLLFRRENAIVQWHHKGGELDSPDAWEARGNAVAVADAPLTGSDVIVTVGEPTIAVVDGKRELYFVYAVRRDNGTIDINAAMVRER